MNNFDLDFNNNQNEVNEVMSNVTGDDCEKAYEDALAKYRTNDNLFPVEASQARQACLDKKAKKEKRGNFFNNLLSGMTTVADTANKYREANQQNSGQQNSNYTTQGYNTPPPSPNDTDVKILGMKPLVFTVVALGVVVMGGIAIAMLGKKASSKVK